MLKDFKAEAVAHFTEHEGRVTHLYQDTVGLVTIGVGCQVFEPFVPSSYGQWYERSSGLPAYTDAIMGDYASVKKMKSGLIAAAYSTACRTRLTEASINDLFMERLSMIEHELALKTSHYSELPEPAQFALLDMGFNLGVGRLCALFPKMLEAVRLRQFALAAKESARSGDAWAKRNKWTADQFMAAENI